MTHITINDGWIRSEYIIHDRPGPRVEHVTPDGCPDDILDTVALGWDEDSATEDDVVELASDIAERWADGYDTNGETITVTVTVSCKAVEVAVQHTIYPPPNEEDTP